MMATLLRDATHDPNTVTLTLNDVYLSAYQRLEPNSQTGIITSNVMFK